MKSTINLLWILFPMFLNAQEISKTNRSEICFESQTIDFGSIEYGSKGIFSFYFTNCGNAPLIISNCQTSCGCLVCASWPKEPIQPGERSKIELKYDTKRIGKTTKSATITSNAGDDYHTQITIKGTVLPPPKAFMADSTINFGTVKSGEKLHFDLAKKGNWQYSYADDTLKILKIEEVFGIKVALEPTRMFLEKYETAKLEFKIPEQHKGTFEYHWEIYFNDRRSPILLKATGEIEK